MHRHLKWEKNRIKPKRIFYLYTYLADCPPLPFIFFLALTIVRLMTLLFLVSFFIVTFRFYQLVVRALYHTLFLCFLSPRLGELKKLFLEFKYASINFYMYIQHIFTWFNSIHSYRTSFSYTLECENTMILCKYLHDNLNPNKCLWKSKNGCEWWKLWTPQKFFKN